jgi:predicted aspartyl protease
MRLPLLLATGLLAAINLASCQYGDPTRVEAPADSAEGVIPFELAGPGGAALMVPVYLNGQGPHPFVLDTGATFTCVNETLADSLNLPSSRVPFGIGAGVGGTGNVQLVEIDSIRVGEAKAFDLTACVLNLDQLGDVGLRVDGLLGLNFLKSFRVTLDFGANTFHLQEP